MLGRACILLLFVTLAPAGGAGGGVADGVIAVVGDTPILVSDLRLAQAVRLVPREDDAGAWGRKLLDARLRLEVEYQDLTAGETLRVTADPGPVLERLAGAAGGRAALERRLAAWGLSTGDLEDLASRIATVEQAVETRFRRGIRISAAEIEEAYREELAPRVRAGGGTAPPLEDVRDRLGRLLAERRLNKRLERWLREAGERYPVIRYRPWTAEPEPAAAP